RADVGAAMALDLGLVLHAADAEAVEGAPEGMGDRATDGRLADAGWPHEQHDAACEGALEDPGRDVLEDAFLDVLEAVMAFVERLARARERDLAIGLHPPGQGGEPVE